MIKQYLRKKAVISNGIVNTYLRRNAQPYDDKTWWDATFYTDGISDRQTIRADKHRISAMQHYNSVESKILEHLYNHRIQKTARLWGAKVRDTDPFGRARILDIGSGSGHWIDFYRSLGATELVGVEVSELAVKFLRNKYSDSPGITILHGKAATIIEAFGGTFDVVNAIGVMFHITDDAEWVRTIDAIANKLSDDGLLIVGGHFGWFDGLNVQIDEAGQINKRLRSLRRWRKELKNVGFSHADLYRNNAYLHINDPLPENNVLISSRTSTH